MNDIRRKIHEAQQIRAQQDGAELNPIQQALGRVLAGRTRPLSYAQVAPEPEEPGRKQQRKAVAAALAAILKRHYARADLR